jgi:aspartyl-tRNA(Asn)/glutamyl-tRNA(Gln) amidotransferase subunit B
MPELPEKKREKYSNLGIPRDLIEIIIADIRLDAFFVRIVNSMINQGAEYLKTAANLLVSDLRPQIVDINQLEQCSAENLASVACMFGSGKINSRIAKDILADAVFKGIEPEKIIIERGLTQMDSEESVRSLVGEVLALHPTVVADFKAGKQAALQFLVGQGMRASKGAAKPTLLAEIIKDEIAKI